MSSYDELLEFLRTVPVIDTHEHLEGELHQPSINALHDYTRHYFNCDLISAGLDPKVIPRLADPTIDSLTKWKWLEKSWENCRLTGYGRMLDLAVQRLYNVPRVDATTIEQIEAGYRALRLTPRYSHKIMQEICGIRHCVNNIWHMNGDTEDGFYWFVTQADPWIVADTSSWSQDQKAGLNTIDDWMDRCITALNDDFEMRGAKGIKLGIAYRRSLKFVEASKMAAQAGYETLLKGQAALYPDKIRDMQDYILHGIMSWANDNHKLVQIHTGYQEGNGGMLPNTDPSLLINLFLLYPNIRFDLFHIGYPYQNIMGALGKQFPNVYINLCWSHILSPVATIRALEEWLLCVPVNKIFAFGGDCLFFDGVIGHLELALRGVARALATHVDAGTIEIERAKEIGRMLFYDNPAQCYGMV